LRVSVTFSSESFPFSESEESAFFSDSVLDEFSGVDFTFTEETGRSDGGGDLFINNDGLNQFLSDGLGSDYWLNEFNSLLQVDGFSDSDLLLDGDVVSDFDLLGESLGFEGLDFLHSGNRFNDFNLLHDGDVFNDLNSLGDKSRFNDFDFLHNNFGFANFDLLGDGDSLSVLDFLDDLGGFKNFDVFKSGSSFNDINFLHESSGFNNLLLFSEDVSVVNGGSLVDNDFLFNNNGLFNDSDVFSFHDIAGRNDGLFETGLVEARVTESEISGEGGFHQDLTSRLVLVGQRIPSAGLTARLELIQVKKEAADVIITGETVLVHKFNNDLGLSTNGDGNSVIPVGVLATLLADLSLEDAVTNDESAIRVHLTDQIGVVGKVSFNRSEGNSARHL